MRSQKLRLIIFRAVKNVKKGFQIQPRNAVLKNFMRSSKQKKIVGQELNAEKNNCRAGAL